MDISLCFIAWLPIWGWGVLWIFLHTLILILTLTLSALLPYIQHLKDLSFILSVNAESFKVIFFFSGLLLYHQNPAANSHWLALSKVHEFVGEISFPSLALLPPTPPHLPTPTPPALLNAVDILSVPLLSPAFCVLFPSRHDLRERTEDGYKLSDWSSWYISPVTAVYIGMLQFI